METDNLVNVVSPFSPDEQTVVREFIRYLKEGRINSHDSRFEAAVKEFTAAHPELLRHLAE